MRAQLRVIGADETRMERHPLYVEEIWIGVDRETYNWVPALKRTRGVTDGTGLPDPLRELEPRQHDVERVERR
jgi:hypothetical protein